MARTTSAPGGDHGHDQFRPDDDRFLVDRVRRVHHYDVTEPPTPA